MRNYLGLVLLGTLPVFGACGEGGQAAQADEPDGPVSFTALDGTGVQGNVEVERIAAGITRIRAELREATGAGVFPGQLRQGSCDSPGSVVAELNALATAVNGQGSVTTTLQRSSRDFTDGNHVVVYNQPNGSAGDPIVCARLPRRQAR